LTNVLGDSSLFICISLRLLLVVKTQFVARIGQPGDADDSLFLPVGVTVNQRGDVIVCDMRHNAVKVFSSDGKLLFLIKGDVSMVHFYLSFTVTHIIMQYCL